jgi:hypothetical protein
MPRSRILGAIPLLPYASSCRSTCLSTGYVFMERYLFKHRANLHPPYSSSFSVALQFLKNFARLRCLYVRFRNKKLFVWWGCLHHAQPPTWRTSGPHLVWFLHSDLSGLGDPARSLCSRQQSCRGHQSSQASPPTACAARGWYEFISPLQNSMWCVF